jgi:hypothetical protein
MKPLSIAAFIRRLKKRKPGWNSGSRKAKNHRHSFSSGPWVRMVYGLRIIFTRKEWKSIMSICILCDRTRVKADKIKFERDKAEIEECTYHPVINELSRSMIKPRAQPIPEHLIAQGKMVRDKIESQKTYLQSQEEACTFHPQINPMYFKIKTFHRSANIVEAKKSSEDTSRIFENLH